MKTLLATFFFISLFFSCIGQNSIAKLKYEEATEAYTSNEFLTALTKLDEAENILGSTNPKILYLRIVAQHKLIEAIGQKGFTNEDFALILSNCKNAEAYMTNYELVPANKENFTEVYRVSESLKKYPKTIGLFESYIKKKTEERLAMLVRTKNTIDSFCTAYKFKKELSETEFMAYNTEAALIMNKKKQTKNADGGFTYANANTLGPAFVIVKDNKVISFSYALKVSKMPAELNEFYKKYSQFLTDNLAGAEIQPWDYEGISNVTYTVKDAYCVLRLNMIPALNIVLLHFDLFNEPL